MVVLKETSMSLFLTEEGIRPSCPPLELVGYLAKTWGIVDQQHRVPLHTALAEKNRRRIQEIFYREDLSKREELVYDSKYIRRRRDKSEI